MILELSAFSSSFNDKKAYLSGVEGNSQMPMNILKKLKRRLTELTNSKDDVNSKKIAQIITEQIKNLWKHEEMF